MATAIEKPIEQTADVDLADLILASRKFTPDEYMRMAKAGILGEDERLELLEGNIIKMMVRKPEHDACLLNVDDALRQFCPGDIYLRIQMAVALADSHPEPDCAVIRGPRKKHTHRFPGPDEIELVVEVSDSSLQRDRGIKARIYARAGIRKYWILNVEERQLEVLTDPTGDVEKPSYRNTVILKPGDKIALVLGGNKAGEIAVADLLP